MEYLPATLIDGVFPIALAFLLGMVCCSVLYTVRKSKGNAGTMGGRESPERKKRRKTYPKNHPNGWFKLMNSDELKCGESKYLAALGKEFAIFRGQDGNVGVLDAHCPHMGANLTVGGVVVDNCLQCPFHKWEFAASGQCTKIPYLEKETVPSQIKTTSYTVKEYYGMILIYHDSLNRLPTYEPPVYSDFENKYRYAGKWSTTANIHLMEFAENGGDYQHMDTVHGGMKIPFLQIPVPFVKIVHGMVWSIDKDEPRFAHTNNTAHLTIFGKTIPRTNAGGKSTFVGPAGVVAFELYAPGGKILLFQTQLPLEPLVTRVEFLWYAEKHLSSFLVWYFVGTWIAQWQNDIAIWENKVLKSNPLIVKGDGPIAQQRKWFSQFYDSHNKSSSPLDW